MSEETRYNKILNDPVIINYYQLIAKLEDRRSDGWAHHDLNHVKNVANLVEQILNKLREDNDNFIYDDNFIEEAKIAAILHDIGMFRGKKKHNEYGAEYAKYYLKKRNITLEHEGEVIDAIQVHREGFETNNIIAIIIILADKLDIQKTRVAKNGRNIPGMRQMLHITGIDIKIENKVFIVNFISDNYINKPELEGFYFTKKVFFAIREFSKKMKLTPNILFNGVQWDLHSENQLEK